MCRHWAAAEEAGFTPSTESIDSARTISELLKAVLECLVFGGDSTLRPLGRELEVTGSEPDRLLQLPMVDKEVYDIVSAFFNSPGSTYPDIRS